MNFISIYRNHSIVITPGQYSRDNLGSRIFHAGKRADFVDWKFDTEDKDIIDGLLNHKDYGRFFWSPEVGKGIKMTDAAKREKLEEDAQKQQLVTACSKCSFTAKTEFGLRTHIRMKHPA